VHKGVMLDKSSKYIYTSQCTAIYVEFCMQNVHNDTVLLIFVFRKVSGCSGRQQKTQQWSINISC